MTLTKVQTSKLLSHLTGKEAFTVMMQGYVERSLNKPVTFTDPELKRMMDAVWSSPQRSHEFKQYREAQDVMNACMYEGRLAIEKALSHIMLQSMLNSRIFHNCLKGKEAIAWAEEHAESMQRQYAHITYWLEWVKTWRLLLIAFDTVLTTNMVEMLTHDMGRLQHFIPMYHDRMAWVEQSIIYARMNAAHEANAAQETLDALSAEYVATDEKWQLPDPAATLDADTLQRCITFLHQCPEKERFYKVLDVAGCNLKHIQS